MSNPVFAWIVIGAGVLLLLISAFADPRALSAAAGSEAGVAKVRWLVEGASR